MRRFGWGLADQALSSLTNFALSVMVARSVGGEEFGAYGLAFAAFLLVLNVSRPIASEPFSIRYSSLRVPDLTAARDAIGTVAAIGFAGAVLTLTAGALLGGSLGLALVAMAAVLPGVLVQDAYRLALIALGRGSAAFRSDLAWVFVLAPLVVMLVATGNTRFELFILAWGFGGMVGAIAGAIMLGGVPNPRAAGAWWRRHSSLARPLLVERLATSSSGQLSQYAIASIGGLKTVGSLRAGEVMLGPLNILYQGLQLVALPEVSRRAVLSAGNVVRASALFSGVLAAAVVFWAAVAYSIPATIGVTLLGENWAPGHSVVLIQAVALCGLVIAAGAGIGLRAIERASAVMWIGLLTSTVTLIAAVIGTIVDGARGGAAGMALGAWVGAVAGWSALGSATRGHPTPHVGGRRPAEAETLPRPEPGP